MHLWGDGMSLGLVYKNGEHIFDEVCGEVPFLTYPLFEKTGVVKSAFSTRIGGVSKGCYESMNLSFDRGDDKDAVMENFQRIASAIGTNCHDMVLSRQTHTANVRVVTEEDKGKAVRAVLDQIAHIFKGGEGEGDCYCGSLDFIALRLKHQQIEHQRQQLHHFLHHRRDLRRGGKGVRLTHRRKEGVDIGRKQAHPHPGNAKQEKAELPPAHAQSGHQQGRHHAQEDVFDVGHASTAFLVAGSSPRIASVSSISHQKVGLAKEVSGQKQPAVHSRYSAYTKHSTPM